MNLQVVERQPYTEEENARILEVMQNPKAGMDLEAVFMFLAEELGRSFNSVKGRYYKILKPVAEETVELDDSRSILQGLRGVVKERDKLREENRALKTELEDSRGLRKEYNKLLSELKMLLGEDVEVSKVVTQQGEKGMGRSKSNLPWEDPERDSLVDVIVEFAREGKTMAEAFEQAATVLDRTPQACSYMWHSSASRDPQVKIRLSEARNQRIYGRKFKNEDDRGQGVSDNRGSSPSYQEDTTDN